jgi:hypothetical protein
MPDLCCWEQWPVAYCYTSGIYVDAENHPIYRVCSTSISSVLATSFGQTVFFFHAFLLYQKQKRKILFGNQTISIL